MILQQYQKIDCPIERSVKTVVIVGAGQTAMRIAEMIHRRHPHCQIHWIDAGWQSGSALHTVQHRPNQAAIQQDFQSHSTFCCDGSRIVCWPGMNVQKIDRMLRTVTLESGQTIAYDRLILTSSERIPAATFPRYELAGSADQQTTAGNRRARRPTQLHRNALVVGDGQTALAQIDTLYQAGFAVSWLVETDSPLHQRLDALSNRLLQAALEAKGIRILSEAKLASRLVKSAQIQRHRPSKRGKASNRSGDWFMIDQGVNQAIRLARACGIIVKQGIVVDPWMRTSDPYILAAGDIVEFDTRCYSRNAAILDQSEMVVLRAIAGPGISMAQVAAMPAMIHSNVAGIDIFSVGYLQARGRQDQEIVVEARANDCYRKLVIADGKIIGAILLNYPQDVPSVMLAIKLQTDIGDCVDALRLGNWDVIATVRS